MIDAFKRRSLFRFGLKPGLLCLLGLALAGCSTLPDFKLAKATHRSGNIDTAISYYAMLADAGYPKAHTSLGDIYRKAGVHQQLLLAEQHYRQAVAKSNPNSRASSQLKLAELLARKDNATPSDLREAEQLFQALYAAGDENVFQLLTKLLNRHPEIWPRQYTLSIINDGLDRQVADANFALVDLYQTQGTPDHVSLADMAQLCEQVVNQVEECYLTLVEIYLKSDNETALLALFERAALQTEKAVITPTIAYRMANMAWKNDFAAPRLALADQTYAAIEKRYPKALITRIRLRLDNPYFTDLADTTVLLEQAAERQLPEVHLLTGKLHYDGKLTAMDPLLAETSLLKVSGRFRSADYLLGQIYLNGYLGKPQFTAAVTHLLLAARAGLHKADYTLAELYGPNKGAVPNIRFAHLFATLATDSQRPLQLEKANQLLATLNDQITPEQLAASTKLLQQERALRLSPKSQPAALALMAKATDGPIAPIQPPQAYQAFQSTLSTQPFTPSLDWTTSVQLRYSSDDAQSLDPNSSGHSNEAQINIKPSVTAKISKQLTLFAQLQAFSATETSTIDSDDGGAESDGFIGLRELWFDYQGLSRYPGESIRLGLQRVREPDGIWWDQNIESARWMLDTTTLSSFVGIGQQFHTYRSDQNSLDQRDQHQLNLFASSDWQWSPGHHLGGRLLYKRHNAAKTPLGTGVSPRNLAQLARGDFYWLGINAKSDYFNYRDQRPLNYYAELTWLHFNGDNASLSANTATPSVTGYRADSFNNYALDFGLRWKLPVAPNLHLGTAFALSSGGSSGTRQQSFVQTGLHSNRSRFTGTQASFHRFNEAYRAELTNLRVSTLYGTLTDPNHYDISLVYHYFQRDDTTAEVISTGINSALVNNDRELGHGVDLITSYYFRQLTPWTKWTLGQDAYVRLRASAFKPGDAYGPQADDLTYRITIDTSLKF